MIRNNWIETSMSVTNSTAMLHQEGNYFYDAASTRSSTRSGIYIDDNNHIVVNNVSLYSMGNGTGIIRSNYTSAGTDTYTCVRLPLRFYCTDTFHGELYREDSGIMLDSIPDDNPQFNAPLSEAISHHQENLSQLREESERARQEIIDKQARREKEKQLASERARSLLLEFLDEENKQKLLTKQNLEILSGIFPDITYFISTTKKDELIKAINNERGEVDRLCLVVSEIDEDNQDNWLPVEDIILSKVLYLLNAEEDFLRIARHHGNSDNHENLYDRIVLDIPVGE